MRPALLFLSNRPPYPVTSGSRLRTQRLATGLAKEYEVSFLTFDHHRRSPDGSCSRAQLESVLPGIDIHTVPGLGPYKRFSQARSLLSSHSWSYGRYKRRDMAAALRREATRLCPAVVHFDDPGVAQLDPVPGALNVFSAHNIEHERFQQVAETSAGIRRLFASVEHAKVRREEHEIWRRMDLDLAVTPEEAATMAAAGAARVDVCPNGTDPVDLLPPARRAPGDPLRLLFVGKLDYLPNERGVAWFASQVLPELRRRVACRLDVVGARPRRPVAGEGINYVGAVSPGEMALWYKNAHAAVIPLFHGSGTSLKFLEAMAFGRPVVSTAVGARGLPVAAGRHYLRADEPTPFVRHLTAIATAVELQEEWLAVIVHQARSAVAPYFWPNITAKVASLYQAETTRVPQHR